jgi:molybdopterin-containing oxidoreductase family membrane subunit
MQKKRPFRFQSAPEIEDRVLFAPIIRTDRSVWMVIGALLLVIAIGAVAYVVQLNQGLGVTGLNRPIFWGIYIINFVFFIGISHAGTLISAILRVTGAEWRRPITRAAEAITFFSLTMGGAMILIDLGRIDRIWELYLMGRFQSPLLWDVSSITVYMFSSITYLYLPLIPDLALSLDTVGDQLPAWKRKLYQILSLGWTGSERQVHRLEVAIGILAVLIIPVAVSVHTVVAWIFSMSVQPGWHTALLGPYFVVGAIFSGIAAIIIVMAVLRRVFHLEEYLTPRHFNNLGLLLLVMVGGWFYFTAAEFITEVYGNEPAHMRVVDSKFTGEFAPYFWTMTVFCFVIPLIILAFKKLRTIRGTVVASTLIVIGMWLERFLIIVPTLSRPRLSPPVGFYTPTWVEIAITAAAFAVFILLYVVFSQLFPIISIWEVREGRELEQHAKALSKEA